MSAITACFCRVLRRVITFDTDPCEKSVFCLVLDIEVPHAVRLIPILLFYLEMNITSAGRTQNHCGRGLTQCEAKGLRESVVKLQKELRLSKAEAEDALNQLNCFKYLVKKYV